jgi:hypothetical protein
VITSPRRATDACRQLRELMYKTLHAVPEHAINYILRAADGAAFVVVRAALHRCAHVVDDFCARDGSVNGGGISQIS